MLSANGPQHQVQTVLSHKQVYFGIHTDDMLPGNRQLLHVCTQAIVGLFPDIQPDVQCMLLVNYPAQCRHCADRPPMLAQLPDFAAESTYPCPPPPTSPFPILAAQQVLHAIL